MEYITAMEAAKKWKISKRMVQKYCLNGRIEGAVKVDFSWSIPVNARKPKDLRKTKNMPKKVSADNEKLNLAGLMPLMNTSFDPGECHEVIENMEDGKIKDIAVAEYHYFSGQIEKAAEEAELYITCKDTNIRLSACLIYAYANLSMGQISHAKYALSEVENIFVSSDNNKNPQFIAAKAFVASAASVLLHLPLPEKLPDLQEFLPLLPPGIRGFALYVQAHYLYLQQEYEKSIGIAETALLMGAEEYPISAIYLHLVAVMSYMSLRNQEMAQKHLLIAWKIAQPDDLIEGFGEHHGLLGGMLEAVIKPNWPDDFKRIIDITYRFSAGWRKIHNPVTGHDVADNLTTTEFALAMLAARGWTNQEIADHFGISANTVKKYISLVMKKLKISHRRELKKYMLL